jgi:hypothetical protein
MAKPKQNKDTKPEGSGFSPTTTQIIVALIGAITTIIITVMAMPSVNKWLQSLTEPSPTPVLPTTTPVPFARVQSLDVIQDGNIIDTLAPDGKMTLPVGSNVIFRVNVITKTDVNDLVFSWEFCRPDKNTKGQGAVEIPYKVSQDGDDCITVKIERGGQILTIAHFLVSTE